MKPNDENETAAVTNTGTEPESDEKQTRQSDSHIVIFRTIQAEPVEDGEDEEVEQYEVIDETFDSKVDAEAWLKANGQDGEEYTIARAWPTVKVATVTTLTKV